jgi:hypothetical protein
VRHLRQYPERNRRRMFIDQEAAEPHLQVLSLPHDG